MIHCTGIVHPLLFNISYHLNRLWQYLVYNFLFCSVYNTRHSLHSALPDEEQQRLFETLHKICQLHCGSPLLPHRSQLIIKLHLNWASGTLLNVARNLAEVKRLQHSNPPNIYCRLISQTIRVTKINADHIGTRLLIVAADTFPVAGSMNECFVPEFSDINTSVSHVGYQISHIESSFGTPRDSNVVLTKVTKSLPCHTLKIPVLHTNSTWFLAWIAVNGSPPWEVFQSSNLVH